MGGCGGTWGSGSGASGWLMCGGGVGSVGVVGECAVCGGVRECRCLRDRASSLESGQSGGVCGSWGASRGAAWYWRGGGPLLSMKPPRRGVVAAAAGGMGRVTVPGGGPLLAWTWWPGGYGSWYGGGGWYGGGWPLEVGGYARGALDGCHPIRWCCSCTGGCGLVG